MSSPIDVPRLSSVVAVAALMSGAVALSCTAVLGDSDGSGDGPLGDIDPGRAEIEASCREESFLLTSRLRRLSEEQIRNSIQDVFGELFDDATWPQMEDGARLIGMNLMADKLNVNNLNFERIYDSSRSLSATVVAEHQDFAGCAVETSADCVDELMGRYMHQMWRGAETEQDKTELRAQLAKFDSNEKKLEFVVNALVLGSKFLFRTEVGEEVSGERALDNYEIASFLSYAIWNSTPDQELLILADQPDPLGSEQIDAQITRMVADPRADRGLLGLYKDYLKLDLVLEREKAAEFGFGAAERRDVLASAENMLASKVGAGASVMDVFGSSPFYVNETTAEFFNTASDSSELEAVELADRHGILTHPAFLAVHSTLSESGIVKRGVFTLEQLLCMELPDPPPDVSGVDPPEDLDPEQTSERELLVITHSSQAACRGCHELIDPAGFGFENYDAVGRYRETEKGNVPIDASGSLDGVGSYENGVEYARALLASDKMKRCVSRRFLEHYFGQELKHNSCIVEHYQAQLDESDGSVRSLLTTLSDMQTFIRSRSQ